MKLTKALSLLLLVASSFAAEDKEERTNNCGNTLRSIECLNRFHRKINTNDFSFLRKVCDRYECRNCLAVENAENCNECVKYIVVKRGWEHKCYEINFDLRHAFDVSVPCYY